ncbi:hypothetical protein EV682_109131 [Iodobacter fluviatilis]|uniref:Uncharacterized protein n=1 Tax=Iodobacter fluviatilis TaxID=537 RepID=A0A377Q891_9NEIS|nr:hypothetical protein EV682_109131 [Iodobacter fluviatilis]STQ90071.1 Uncharacterised protein [Iodobacter fluviatilis]
MSNYSLLYQHNGVTTEGALHSKRPVVLEGKVISFGAIKALASSKTSRISVVEEQGIVHFRRNF